MFNSKLNRGVVLIVLMLIILPLAVFGGGKKEEPKEDVSVEVQTDNSTAEREPIGGVAGEAAAVVNGSVIPLKAFNGQVQAIIQQYAGQGINIPEDQLGDLKLKIINNLVDQELIYQDAVAKGIKVSDEAVAAQLDAIKGQFPDEATYLNVLSSQGMTEEAVRNDIGKSLLVEDYVTGKFGPLIKIEESDIIDFYTENSQYFSTPEQVRASHILIKVEPDAEESVKKDALSRINEIKARLESGEEFSELARTMSEGPSNVNGGDLGTFGRGQMVKSFEDVVFAMNVGDVSDVVETQFGYHLIRLTSKNAPGSVPLEEVKGQISDHLKQLKMAEMINGYVATIKPDAVIEILVP